MQGDFDHPPMVIASSAAKSVWMLTVCIVFVVVAAWVLARGVATTKGYVGVYGGLLLFGPGVVVALWRLWSPARLELSPHGLGWFNGWTMRRYRWSYFERFVAYRPTPRTRSYHLGFVRALGPVEPGGAGGMVRALTGVDGGFGGEWELGTAELVSVLNAAKMRWA